jgi:hypothetical protein
MTAEDFEPCAPAVFEADVFIPEFVTIPPGVARKKQRVGSGDAREYGRVNQWLEGDFGRAVLKTIYDRGRKRRIDVPMLDVPATSSWISRIAELRHFENEFEIDTTSVDATLARVERRAERFVKIQEARDELFVDNVAGYLNEYTSSHRSSKQGVSVYITRGYMHKTVIDKLAKKDLHVVLAKNSFSGPVPPLSRVVEKVWNGEKPSKSMLVEAFIGACILSHPTLQPGTPSSAVRFAAADAIMHNLTNDQLSIYSERIINEGQRGGTAGVTEARDEIIYDATGLSSFGPAEVQLLARKVLGR